MQPSANDYANSLVRAGLKRSTASTQALVLAEHIERVLVTKTELRHEVELLRRDVKIWLGATVVSLLGLVGLILEIASRLNK